jgi:hypothetical protein
VLASEQQNDLWHPWQEPGMTWEKLKEMGTLHWAVNAQTFAPTRQAGEGVVLRDHIALEDGYPIAYSCEDCNHRHDVIWVEDDEDRTVL